jgi:hypothetical protein
MANGVADLGLPTYSALAMEPPFAFTSAITIGPSENSIFSVFGVRSRRYSFLAATLQDMIKQHRRLSS